MIEGKSIIHGTYWSKYSNATLFFINFVFIFFIAAKKELKEKSEKLAEAEEDNKKQSKLFWLFSIYFNVWSHDNIGSYAVLLLLLDCTIIALILLYQYL